MAKEYMKRIEALRQQYLATRVDMDVYNAKYLTEGFKESEGEPQTAPPASSRTNWTPSPLVSLTRSI